MVSNVELEKMVENITIMNYHSSLNEMLVSTAHMINVFNNTKSVSDTFSRPVPSARVSTFGFVDFHTGEEKLFFPLDNIREIKYYYGIPRSKLETEAQLFRKIVDQVKSRKTENIKVSYGIYATEYEEEYVYMIAHSSRIQEIEKS